MGCIFGSLGHVALGNVSLVVKVEVLVVFGHSCIHMYFSYCLYCYTICHIPYRCRYASFLHVSFLGIFLGLFSAHNYSTVLTETSR